MLTELVGGFRRGPTHREEHFGRQAHYESYGPGHNMSHGRRPVTHMTVCDEDSEGEFYESSRNNQLLHHQQNFISSAPVSQSHHMGNMGHGWDKMQHTGGHGMPHHGGHGMPHTNSHGGYGMPQHGNHGGHGMQHHGGHGMPHNTSGGYGMQHHGGHNMHGGGGRSEVVKVSENWRASSGSHQKVGWGSKGL